MNGNPECPICEGVSVPLGELGSYTIYRCRYCGFEFRRLIEDNEVDGVDGLCCFDFDLNDTDPFGDGR